MFTPLKPPRGSAAQVAMHTGVEGSIVVNTDAKTIHVHDGVTPGGFALSKVGHQHTKNEMISFLGYLPVDPSTIGQANGVAPLDATGKVPASMIPNGAGGGGVSDAGDLTGTTLSPSVVNSSLTSVGVLQNLTVAGVISGSVSGSASKLSNARSIVISGDVDGSASFDGSADINISVALDNVNSSPVENALKKITVNAKGQVISTDDVSPQDLSDVLGFTPVSQSYVDGVASNFVQRPGVRFASDANLAGTYSNGTTGEDATLSGSGSIPAIGGGTPVLNDRIALMYQSNGVQNGIYKVTQTNPWVLTRDGGLDDVKNGAMVLVAEGTHAGEKWIQIAPNPITLGTSSLQYTMFQAAATAYQSGAGISIQNNTITNTGVRSLAGTPNQISFSASTGAITASLTPSVTISGTMTAGSFAGSGASLTGLNAANLSAGIVPTARLGSGTADGTTFLAGDGTWKNISVDASNLAGFGEVAYNANKRGVYAGVRTIVNQGANPVVVLNQTGASSGNRTSIISALADGSIRWTLNSDDMSSLGAFMSVYRNVGTATSIVFTSTAFQIQANASIAGTLNVSSVITGNGSGLTALNASSLSSGTVPAARLGSGTANANTFLAGDGTWRSATASTINATGQVTLDSSRAGFSAGLNPSSNPLVYMVNAAALTNSKVMYQSYTSAGVFNMGWMTDAGSQATPFLAATRNGGDVTTANLVLTADIVNVQGTLSATSFSGNGSALTNLDASKLIGVARPANLGAGTANALTFLRGDGSWAVVNPTTLAGTGDIPTSSTVSGVYAGRLSGNSLMQFVNLNAPSGKRVWDMRVDTNGDFAVGTMTDAVTDLTYALRIQRTAAGASNITLDATNITLSGVIQGNGAYSTTGAISAASFTGNGSGLTNLNASNITTGVVAPARLGSGTANNSTFLRGDGTWATVTSTWNGGTVSAATSFTSTLAVKSVSGDVVAVAASNIDCSAGNYFTKTASGALTWTVSNVPASRFYSFILKLTNGGTGAQTWFSNTKWEGGTAPTLSASGVDILGFFTDDGGATWHGIALSIGSR